MFSLKISIEIYGNPREPTGTHIWYFSDTPHFLNSDQEMGDTKVSIKGLHEDMRIFASEVTEESKSATDRVKKLGIL